MRSGELARADTRVDRVSEIARAAKSAAVLVSDPASVRWLAPGAAEGARALVGEGAVHVIGPESSEAGPTRLRGPSATDLEAALGSLGIDAADPLATDGARRGAPSRRRWVDVASEVALARAIKDEGELMRIRSASDLVATGQRAARTAARAGVSEEEIWAAAQATMTAFARVPVEAEVDLMAGPRTALVGEPPGQGRVGAGDPILFDLAPRSLGYWADSCATFAAGAPGPQLVARHGAVMRALEAGIAAARPGAEAREVDSVVRSTLAEAGLECPHHTGHGVGVEAQEPPWLVPGDSTVLAEGMVLAIEPGAYSGGFGLRLEHLAVVEADGATPLTHHSLSVT